MMECESQERIDVEWEGRFTGLHNFYAWMTIIIYGGYHTFSEDRDYIYSVSTFTMLNVRRYL